MSDFLISSFSRTVLHSSLLYNLFQSLLVYLTLPHSLSLALLWAYRDPIERHRSDTHTFMPYLPTVCFPLQRACFSASLLFLLTIVHSRAGRQPRSLVLSRSLNDTRRQPMTPPTNQHGRLADFPEKRPGVMLIRKVLRPPLSYRKKRVSTSKKKGISEHI